MSHTGAVFAALLVAFVIFITARGELAPYVGVMFGKCQKGN